MATAEVLDDPDVTPLPLAPDREQQIRWLNEQVGDGDLYAKLWFACVRSVGCAPYVVYDDRGRQLSAMIPADGYRDRGDRLAALVAHSDRHGMRAAVMRHVEAEYVVDRRHNSVLAACRGVRWLLRSGFNIHLTPEGVLDHSRGMPVGYHDGARSALGVENAFRYYTTMLRLPGVPGLVERIVRRLGRGHGQFIVLDPQVLQLSAQVRA